MLYHFADQFRLLSASECFYYFGMLCGVAIACVLGVLYVALAGPLHELFMEKFIDPWQHNRFQPAVSPPVDGAGTQGILVSDLHIDTWQELGMDAPDESNANPSRGRAFLDFLAAISDARRVDSFYVNGDVMDIPLSPLKFPNEPLMLSVDGREGGQEGVLAQRLDQILRFLLTIRPREHGKGVQRALMLTGNHDIGVCGLRYVRPTMPDFLPNVGIAWNPSILITNGADGSEYERYVYVEHGHRWDPFLWLYMRYALFDLTRGGHHRREGQLIDGLQRGGKLGMSAPKAIPETKLSPLVSSANKKWDYEDEAANGSSLEYLVRLRYRQAARRVFRQFRQERQNRIHTIIFGHTHLPDRYEFPDGRVYINSGDWCGNKSHQTYSVIEPNGMVRGPFQWRNREQSEFA